MRWHGPAILIGFEGNNCWVSHRGTTLKVAARHLRTCTQEETMPLDDILRQVASRDPLLAAPNADAYTST